MAKMANRWFKSQFLRSPQKSTPSSWEQVPSLGSPKQTGQKEGKPLMNLNEVTLIGYIGKDAETKTLPSGTQVISFSVATNSFWKDNNGEERKNTQWHNIVAYGDGFAKFADRLTKGSQVFVRGQLLTREYETTVDVKEGKKPVQVKVKKLAVEIKASFINSLERSQANDEPTPGDDQDIPQ